MTGWIIDQLSDWTDVDPETRCDEADWKWAATEQLVRPRPGVRLTRGGGRTINSAKLNPLGL
jgi:hypothetical protein